MTAPTVRSYMQIFSRFGGTWHRKVHFSTFSGKLTFQCTRNGFQNPTFCPGSLQDTFIIYSSISHQHVSQKKIENRTSENLKIPKPRFTNRSPVLSKICSNNMLVRYRGINNKGVLDRPWTKWRVLMSISDTLKFQFTVKC